jgi:hypothetical protein
MNDHYRTPQLLYDELNREFNFDFDPCPFNEAPNFDGLEISWGKINFVNPPYSQIGEWCQKSYYEYLEGKTIVMLIPSRTDTRYWHDYVMKAQEIRFLRGRLKFDNSIYNCPFPHSIIIFNPVVNK